MNHLGASVSSAYAGRARKWSAHRNHVLEKARCCFLLIKIDGTWSHAVLPLCFDEKDDSHPAYWSCKKGPATQSSLRLLCTCIRCQRWTIAKQPLTSLSLEVFQALCCAYGTVPSADVTTYVPESSWSTKVNTWFALLSNLPTISVAQRIVTYPILPTTKTEWQVEG